MSTSATSIKRTASAHWQGWGTDGTGHLTTDSTVLEQARYSYHTRFEEGVGTNPEELIAAAQAGCFAMKLAFNLQTAGYTADYIDARCQVVLQDGCIRETNLTVTAAVPGLTPEHFQQLVADAQRNCPVAKVLRVESSCLAQLD